jgi:hypothetical protein
MDSHYSELSSDHIRHNGQKKIAVIPLVVVLHMRIKSRIHRSFFYHEGGIYRNLFVCIGRGNAGGPKFNGYGGGSVLFIGFNGFRHLKSPGPVGIAGYKNDILDGIGFEKTNDVLLFCRVAVPGIGIDDTPPAKGGNIQFWKK